MTSCSRKAKDKLYGTTSFIPDERCETQLFTSTQEGLHPSGRVVRQPERYMFLGESLDRIPEELDTKPLNYTKAL